VTPDLHTLVGPYVVDALPDDERAQFEEHLRRCAECQAEVAGLQATAAQLGRASAIVPPPDMKARVLADVARTRQVPPGPRTASPHAGRWPVLLAAAALILLIAAVATVAVRTDRRADEAEQLAAVVADPAARSVEVSGEAGTMRLVVSEAHDGSVLLADGMPPAPSGKDYELWYRTDGRMVPAGVFEPDDEGTVRERLDAVPEDLVGVTLEPEGGSAEPTLPMIAEGTL
jgi:anti-sigma-K factor RskA